LNHSSSNCPHGFFSTKCSKCGSTEHSTSNCPHGFFSSKCSNCGSVNHKTSDCPNSRFLSIFFNYRIFSGNKLDENGCIYYVVKFSLIIALICFLIWLLLYFLLPMILLNISVIFLLISIFYKKQRLLLNSISILGGIYLTIELHIRYLINIVNQIFDFNTILPVILILNSLSVFVSVVLIINFLKKIIYNIRISQQRKNILFYALSILFLIVTVIWIISFLSYL
jgi:hypothetical protein